METNLQNTATIYKAYSDQDKIALKELQKEASEKLKREVSLKEIVAAITPGMETPDFMRDKC